MKRIIIVLAIVFASLAGVQAQKFGVVDTKYVLESITEYTAAQEQLDNLSVEWQKEIETKFTEIDKLYKNYQSEQILLPDDMKKSRQEEIIAKEKEAKSLQKQRFGTTGDLQKKRQELVKPIQDRVYAAINDVATKQGYQVIFDKSSDLIMLYVNPKVDVSDAILEQMGYKPGPATKPKKEGK